LKLYTLKFEALSEVLWTWIQEKLDPQTIHNWNFRRQHTCHVEDELWGFKRQNFATGIFKTEFMSFLDKNKKW